MEGYTGKILWIDLNSRRHRVTDTPPELCRKYLGGRGFGARLLYELLPPGTDPLSSKNIFMVLTGPLTGTLAAGSGKHVVVTRSPLTGTFLDSYCSSYLSAELKFAGFDGMIITGKANLPTYIWVDDSKVDLRDASRLMGKDAHDVEDLVREELGDRSIGVMATGPAADNLVRFACINSDYYRQSGRGGAGAVMASKNLKAIAVRGSGGISCANPMKMLKAHFRYIENIKESEAPKIRSKYGTNMAMALTNTAGMMPTKNLQEGKWDEVEGKIDPDSLCKHMISQRGCYACVSTCSHMCKTNIEWAGRSEETLIEGPEYESLVMLGPNLGISDPAVIMKGTDLCDKLGLDSISTGGVIGFAMECFEKGLITLEDTGGIDLSFGNRDGFFQIIEAIAYRRGIGNVLADGVMRASKAIGKGSERFAMHIKGMELPAYDPRGAYGAALTFAVNPRGACHRRAWPPAHEILGHYKPYTVEGKAQLIKQMYTENCYLHCLLVCDFARFVPVLGDPYQQFETLLSHYSEYIGYVTGEPYAPEELKELCDRVETLIRMFNVREGFDRTHDTVPNRILNEPLPSGPAKGLVIGQAAFDRMLDEYYGLRGWDKRGIPLSEALERLELSDIENRRFFR